MVRQGVGSPGCFGSLPGLPLLLYDRPLARVYTPVYLSNIFPLQKGTHQGCPSSPLLFNLALEPLSRYLVEAAEIRGIVVGDIEFKLAQFADDLTFFLAHPSEDVLIVFDHLHTFGLSYGLRINLTKSELLMLSAGCWVPPASLFLTSQSRSPQTTLNILGFL